MTIEEHMIRFLEKIHGKRENVQSIIVYADKYKTRKDPLRSKLIFSSHVIGAKTAGYDPLSATKKLISGNHGCIRTQGGKARQKPQQRSGKYLLI